MVSKYLERIFNLKPKICDNASDRICRGDARRTMPSRSAVDSGPMLVQAGGVGKTCTKIKR